MPKIRVCEAEEILAEAEGDFCECGAVPEEGSEYCFICGSYWEDVARGVFSDLEED